MARWFVDRSAQRGIPAVSLRRLLPEASFAGVSDLVVSGCSADSRRLDPGQVFVALRGRERDGHRYVARALERGAAAVVVERPMPEAGRLQVVVPDTRRAYARISHALAGDPSEAMAVVGVAGPEGRAAVALFLRAILEAAGRRVGLVGGPDEPPGRPEPDAGELAERLGRMVERRCEAAVVALSSARLARGDAEGLALVAAVSTGVAAVGPDPEARRAERHAQARLFRRVAAGGAAVVDADDPDSDLLGAVNLEARRVAFGLGDGPDVAALLDGLDADGSRFRLLGLGREVAVRLRPLGRRPIGWALAAAATARAIGLEAEAVAEGLESVARLPGRPEPLDRRPSAGVAAFRLDRARDGRGLAEALAALRDCGFPRVTCVLAASGDPAADRALAAAAESGADLVVATSATADPRDAASALDDLLAGARRPGRFLVEPEPARALATARALARPGEALLHVATGPEARPARPRRRPAPPLRLSA